MKLRIHFTSDDLMRIRVAEPPDHLWELVNSVHLLQNSEGQLLFRNLRESALGCTRGDRESSRLLRVLMTLSPYSDYFPDFLTPTAGHKDLESGIDAVLSTPTPRLREELALLGSGRRMPSWVDAMARGDTEVLRLLGTAMRWYHDDMLGPLWPTIRAALRADREHRTRTLLRGGGEALLTTLGAGTRWRSPVLEADYPVEHDVHLEGRGVVLVPSFFCWKSPVTLADPAMTPVIVHPIDRDLLWSSTLGVRSGDASGLVSLMGATRARVLETVVELEMATTGTVATTAGLSAPTASKHLTVLRDAGLIQSRPEGRRVLHWPTRLGVDLLRKGG
ncbi:ArsR/SmtB family transcription factor [Nocardiopsis sp. LDBS1602]|uniref:ArsR/SmtB family transcription factor n=1 Tax=Nocardiopsis sp. LDBS1602 TaxID=3109597 RepID=UPI002DBE8981|nr:helix-turn-helix domain-containing protein [Nocardiopsis sp. LDBS1602]MEC3891650.1 helix-turn-helix domain-containing protein [Nocardiopsis sp. LDBS1602]